MAEIIINDVKYTNVPNKKAGTKFASALTQSNIGMSQAVQDYVNSSYFYALINAIDINWDGIDIGENTYINTTSDLIKWIESKAGDIDLSSYATVSYVNQKFEDLIGGAPETLDTLKELADALQEDASLAYVTEALSGKADKTDLNDYATVAYVTTELDKKANVSDIPAAQDLSAYVTYTQANSYYAAKSDIVKSDLYEMNSASNSYILHNPFIVGSSANSVNFVVGLNSEITATHNTYNFIWGLTNTISGNVGHRNFVFGSNHVVDNVMNGFVVGGGNHITNSDEIAFGKYNSSHANTILSIGNGNATSRHNVFEIKDSGYIYIVDTAQGTPYSLQSRLNSKADANDVYTKAEVDNLIPAPVDLSSYATNSQLDNRTLLVKDRTITTFGEHTLDDITEFDLKVHFIQDETLSVQISANNEYANSVGVYLYSGAGSESATDEYFEVNATYVGSDGGYEIWHFTCNAPVDSITFTNNDDPTSLGIEFEMSCGSSIITVIENFDNYATISYTNQLGNTLDGIDRRVTDIEDGWPHRYVSFEDLNNLSYLSYSQANSYYATESDITNLQDSISAVYHYMEDNYTTYAYVTSELENKVDLQNFQRLDYYVYDNCVTYTDANTYYAYKSEIPDVSNYISYSQANSYYVDINSYNALAARVEELASWIVSYHTPGPTPSKQYPSGYWTENSVQKSNIYVMAGDTTTKTFTFNGTPASGWNFTDPMRTGITVNTTTGEITIDPTNMYEDRIGFFISGNYMEDSTYYSGETLINGFVLPTGTDMDFFYLPSSVYVTNISGSQWPTLVNNTGETVTYTSSDTTICTVDSTGMITYVAPGNATVTATAGNHTATISVICETSKMSPNATWTDSQSMMGANQFDAFYNDGVGQKTFTFSGYPSDSWAFDDSASLSNNYVTLDSATGTITVDDLDNINDTIGYTVIATRQEDSQYWSGWGTFNVILHKYQDRPEFYPANEQYYLNNEMTTQYIIMNMSGAAIRTEYVSNDNNVCTVDSTGMITYVGAGSTTITCNAYDINDQLLYSTYVYVNCTNVTPTPTPDYTNVSIHYPMGGQDLPQGTFDTNPFELGNGNITTVIEFAGPEYDVNNFNTDFVLTRDTSYPGNYITTVLDSPSLTYNNGVNTLVFNIDVYAWQGGDGSTPPGTNRDVLTFTHNGVNYITDGIKTYNTGAAT